MAYLLIPEIKENSFGWGPSPANLPAKFKELPYQPFKKSDCIGKVADWTGNTYGESRRAKNKYISSFRKDMPGGQFNNTQLAYAGEENDESKYNLVDNQKIVKPVFGRRKFGQQNQQRNQKNPYQQQKQVGNLRNRNQKFKRNQWRNRVNIVKESSIKIEEEWKQIETYELPNLSKLSSKQPEGEDITTAGMARAYNKKFDGINQSRKMKLDPEKFNKVEFPYVTILEDEVIRDIAKSIEPKKVTVVASDNVISSLMCMSRSVTPWDLVAYKSTNKQKNTKQLVFDIDSERKDFSTIDRILVSETANEPLPQDENVDEINKPMKLTEEATVINQTTAQQVLRYDQNARVFRGNRKYPYDLPDGKIPPSTLYRYRKLFLDNDKNMQLIVRTEVNGYEQTPAAAQIRKDMPNFVKVHCLNEWNPRYCNGIEWRKHLEKQTSTILATEIKNNSFKISKWIMNAKMAGAHNIKLAYVNRDNVRDNKVHNMVYMETYTPNTLAQTTGLNMENCWGVLRCIIDRLLSGKDGKYHIVRAPNEREVNIYLDEMFGYGKKDQEKSSDESGSESDGSDSDDSEAEDKSKEGSSEDSGEGSDKSDDEKSDDEKSGSGSSSGSSKSGSESESDSESGSTSGSGSSSEEESESGSGSDSDDETTDTTSKKT